MTDPRAQGLSRLRIKAGLPALLSHEEVVNWIAFGRVSAADLTGKAEFGAKWVAVYAEGDTRRPEPSEDGSSCSVLSALRALAEGVPVWTPSTSGDPGWQTYSKAHPKVDFVPPAFLEVEHAARHLVGKLERCAADLVTEMQADLDAYARRKARVDAAERGLRDAKLDGLLMAEGPWPTWKYRGVNIIELWPSAEAAPGLSNTAEFAGQDVMSSLPRPQNLAAKTHTAEDEDACADWLVREWPERHHFTKPEWRIEAGVPWPLLSEQAFDRAWSVAARKHPGMSARGRKPRRPK